eukprot:SAG11_NODE_21944_length_415_cov_1.063291_1_plen_28_part_10
MFFFLQVGLSRLVLRLREIIHGRGDTSG